jgi:hypothetical protein
VTDITTEITAGLGRPLDPQTLADRTAIIELVALERYWRDIGEWDAVAECFTEDAVITTTWFQGNAREFALQSKEMADHGRHSKHPITPIYVKIVGDRALVESRAEIQNRDVVNGVEVDTTQYVRFFSRVKRTSVGWRLASFEGIYEKGTIQPVNPHDVVAVDWADVEAATDRPSYRLWYWMMSRRGYDVPHTRIGDDDRDQVRDFYLAENAWLNGEGA